jgi:hypothetical protein
MWRIEFTSSDFLPLLPEACQGNPGAYGFELAWWLAQALAGQGVVTGYPLGEDWGWLIEYIDPSEAEFTIGCASMSNEGDGYRKAAIAWSIFVRPQLSLKDRINGVSHAEKVQQLGQAICTALRGKGIVVTEPAV